MIIDKQLTKGYTFIGEIKKDYEAYYHHNRKSFTLLVIQLDDVYSSSVEYWKYNYELDVQVVDKECLQKLKDFLLDKINTLKVI
jgi:hypothetical protein